MVNPEGMDDASLVAVLKPLLPPPPSGAPGPFALSDESTQRDFASSAGFPPLLTIILGNVDGSFRPIPDLDAQRS